MSSTQDTNLALDAAKLVRHQTLAQLATVMLAQTSALSKNILSLLP